MSYRFAVIDNQRLTNDNAARVWTDRPFTMSGWVKMGTFATGHVFGLTSHTSFSDALLFEVEASTFRARLVRGSASVTAIPSNGLPTGSWVPFVLVVDTGQIRVAVNGGNLASFAIPTISTPPAWTRTFLGAINNGAANQVPFNGRLAALAFHAGAWDQSTVNNHALGWWPSMIGACVHWWPLATNPNAEIGGLNLTNSTAVLESADNPTLINPPAPPVTRRPVITQLF